ncbi:sugar kinase [Fusobacterium perfoetens]|uniref:sugar kinase n=1 Tax=Fusobacterium perfoetens TaxID=852 RepID=UPI0015A45C56|nr:sugar kinase [Fusobacterium perfoetens]MCF2626215.1 sugar kinase [Fusobacterium perfoetens]
MGRIFDFHNREFGLACSGEILLRLSPVNNELLVQGTLLEKNIGGAEFNVATGVSSLGVKSTLITKLPENELGRYAKRVINSNGVDSSFIIDDNSLYRRLAIYFYEYGASPRKPNVTYDRHDSSFQFMNVEELNKEIYEKCEIFHTSGISLGLCENSKQLTKDLIKKFKEKGGLISFDVNFRRNLWGDEENARKEIEEILPSIDILFASEETLRKMFKQIGDMETIMRNFAKEHNISLLASTQRTVNSPKSHNFTSIIYNNKEDKFYSEKSYENIEIIDRIGSGDAYVAGVLYGILKFNDTEKALKYGNACGAIKNTITGDNNCAGAGLIKGIIEDHEFGSTSEMNR